MRARPARSSRASGYVREIEILPITGSPRCDERKRSQPSLRTGGIASDYAGHALLQLGSYVADTGNGEATTDADPRRKTDIGQDRARTPTVNHRLPTTTYRARSDASEPFAEQFREILRQT
jgi:hypothetical protein